MAVIKVYKIMHGGEKADRENVFFVTQNTRTSGCPMQLNSSSFRPDKRKGFCFALNTNQFVELTITRCGDGH